MPKRRNQDKLDLVFKKLRKLEKHFKRDRHVEQEDSSSQCSSSSSSSSSKSDSSMEETPGPSYGNMANEPSQNVLSQTCYAAVEPQLEVQINSDVNLLPSTSNINETGENQGTNDDFSEILGEDPSTSVAYGPDIHKEVASRFTYIATKGLDKEARKNLVEKFQIPNNSKFIAAPKLNAELKAAIIDTAVKRDKSIEIKQCEIAAAISSLGTIISNEIKSGSDKKLIQSLMDMGRLLCDIQYNQSICRRSLILGHVRKELRDHLSSTNIEENLFGQNFIETIKTAKAVSKSSSDLKPEARRQFFSASSSRGNLNSKARPTTRRQQTGQTPRQQQPAAARTRPVTQRRNGQPYSRSSKQNRRQ